MYSVKNTHTKPRTVFKPGLNQSYLLQLKKIGTLLLIITETEERMEQIMFIEILPRKEDSCARQVTTNNKQQYWLNPWHILISNDTSGFTSNTLLKRIQ